MIIKTGWVREANDNDIKMIEAWLPKDKNIESLAVNWKTTRAVYHEKGMLVWEDAATSIPVAYFWGSLNNTSSILEVHPGYRGKGIGREFVEHLIAISSARGELLLEIQCAPESSREFWLAMGFDVQANGLDMFRSRLIGRRIVHLPQALPDERRVPVTITFLPETAAYSDAIVEPLAEYIIYGVENPLTGAITLSEKVACFHLDHGQDLVVQIVIAGARVYRDKAKYAEAAALGITRCENGFAVGALCTATSSRP
jgi:GNAT superfamily N-acetyltransferase